MVSGFPEQWILLPGKTHFRTGKAWYTPSIQVVEN